MAVVKEPVAKFCVNHRNVFYFKILPMAEGEFKT
jgi:hypothetical protein